MIHQTNLNAELLASESRGRKHIPLAVFAVIIIHIVLFLALLVAAGCRASARAKRNAGPNPAAALLAAAETTAPENVISNVISRGTETVTASEPVTEQVHDSVPGPERTAHKRALPSRPRADTPPPPPARIYVVRAGDTVGKIAKEHGVTVPALRSENQLKGDVIRPGQKLRVSPAKAAKKQMASI